jgi:hypothetical protein
MNNWPFPTVVNGKIVMPKVSKKPDLSKYKEALV